MKHLPIAVILLIFAGAAAWVLWPKPVGEDVVIPPTEGEETAGTGEDGPLTLEALARLSQARTQGVGHLENQELTEAVDQFRTVTEAAPQEGLGWRNLAIAQTLQLDRQGPQGATPQGDEKASLLATARAAVEDLAKVEYETATVHYLRGRLAEAAGDADEAFLSYNAAAGAAEADEQLRGLAPALYFAAYNGSLPHRRKMCDREAMTH